MLIYSYECATCGAVTDDRRPMEDRNLAALCPACGSVAERIITPVRTTWVTGKTFNDPAFPTAWDKWYTDREKRRHKEIARESD